MRPHGTLLCQIRFDTARAAPLPILYKMIGLAVGLTGASQDVYCFRWPQVGGGGSVVRRVTGFSLSMRMASWTARSSCGS
jgi:hypothetical protein